MRLSEDSAPLFAKVLNTRQMIEGFVKSNYPEGPEGILIFKADCQRYGMSEQLKILSKREIPETKYSLTIIGDAKGKNNKFGLCSVDGIPFYAGHFLEHKPNGEQGTIQAVCEVRAFINAVRLCRDFCNYKRIDMKDFTLNYFSDARVVTDAIDSNGMTYLTHIIKAVIRETGINVKTEWIRGLDNLADRYTLPEGETVYPDYKAMDEYLRG